MYLLVDFSNAARRVFTQIKKAKLLGNIEENGYVNAARKARGKIKLSEKGSIISTSKYLDNPQDNTVYKATRDKLDKTVKTNDTAGAVWVYKDVRGSKLKTTPIIRGINEKPPMFPKGRETAELRANLKNNNPYVGELKALPNKKRSAKYIGGEAKEYNETKTGFYLKTNKSPYQVQQYKVK